MQFDLYHHFPWWLSPVSGYRILQLITRSRLRFLAAMLAFWLVWNTRTLVYLRFRCTLASPRYSKLVRSPPMYVSHSLRVAVEYVKSDGSIIFFPSNCWLPFTNCGQDKAHQWEPNYSEFAKWWCYSSFMFMSFFSFEKVVLLAMIHYVQTVIYQYSLTWCLALISLWSKILYYFSASTLHRPVEETHKEQ